jgi:DNA mismatch repair ATPase MutL
VPTELSANSYDADSTIVEITTKGDSQQILIKDDGCGMDMSDLKDLVTADCSPYYQQFLTNAS